MEYIKAEIMYPFMQSTNPLNKKYTVDLVNLSEEAIAQLEAEGITVKEDKSGKGKGHFVVATSNFPTNVYDTQGNELPSNVVRRIGNGSVISMPIKTYTTKFGKETFTKLTLGTVRVLEMVEYTPSGHEGSFVYDGPAPDDQKGEDQHDDKADLEDEIPF